MSRSWLLNEPGRWRMFCDVCHEADVATFPNQPDLLPFHQAGWFIGRRVDACPSCVAAGRLPKDEPHPLTLANGATR